MNNSARLTFPIICLQNSLDELKELQIQEGPEENFIALKKAQVNLKASHDYLYKILQHMIDSFETIMDEAHKSGIDDLRIEIREAIDKKRKAEAPNE